MKWPHMKKHSNILRDFFLSKWYISWELLDWLFNWVIAELRVLVSSLLVWPLSSIDSTQRLKEEGQHLGCCTIELYHHESCYSWLTMLGSCNLTQCWIHLRQKAFSPRTVHLHNLIGEAITTLHCTPQQCPCTEDTCGNVHLRFGGGNCGPLFPSVRCWISHPLKACREFKIEKMAITENCLKLRQCSSYLCQMHRVCISIYLLGVYQLTGG